jgi:hypothetical protein
VSATAAAAGADVADDRQARGKPLREYKGVPVYGSGQAPPYLRTRAQLAAKRLKPAADAQPLAYVEAEWAFGALFDPAATVPMRKLNAAAVARRTCSRCKTVAGYNLHGRPCPACQEKNRLAAEWERARTCSRCQKKRSRPFPDQYNRYCRTCKAARAAEKREREAAEARRDRTCPGRDCNRRTATAAQIAAYRAEHGAWSWNPRWCPPCAAARLAEERRRASSCPKCGTRTATDEELDAYTDEHSGLRYFPVRTCEDCVTKQREQEETARREAAEARAAELAALRDWAAAALADPEVLILDTETTGLDDYARIVEIAVLAVDGTVLVDTLVNPGVPIPRQASNIHGITTADVRQPSVPVFAELVDRLAEVIAGRRVLIYNRRFDVERLTYELTVCLNGGAEAAAAWMAKARFEDVMMPYSEWVGEIHEYYGDVRWQRLAGGHRAAGDCRAVIGVLAEMAEMAEAPVAASA